ncbi:TIM barrel domain-containing protein (plasmid) [Rhizobium etli bv. mimosae str. IE4771]|uniref:TIM barrel domain-containing protein n=1 Tax=Rhizobium etli bv. mimosae str. IE4771 TaxID=1432050 RepID=A0A060IBU5_RHIET|nr:TIM barrel domain-containing protein [Rhizobium sp. IE4771]
MQLRRIIAGCPSSDEEVSDYRRRGRGFVLVLTGIGFTGEFASHDAKFMRSPRRLTDATKKVSASGAADLRCSEDGARSTP